MAQKTENWVNNVFIQYFENSFSIRKGRLHVGLSAAVIMGIKNMFSLI